MDASTAESLSRQSSSSVELSPPGTPVNGTLSTNLDDIKEDHMPMDENSFSEGGIDSTELRDSCSGGFDTDGVSGEIKEVVRELLIGIVAQITECKEHQPGLEHARDQEVPRHSAARESAPCNKDSLLCADSHMISPMSEDSGIYSPINRGGKTTDNETTPGSRPVCIEQLSKEHLSSEYKADTSHDSIFDDGVSKEMGKPRSPSFLASLSNEVKYWLGSGDKKRGRGL